MVTVRLASPVDAEALAALNAEFNGVARPAVRVRDSLRTAGAAESVLVAEADDRIIGFASMHTLHSFCYDAPWVEITELYVIPSHRLRGVGRALLDAARSRAAAGGASELILRVNSQNAAAQRLLAVMGLERVPHLVFSATVTAGITT